MGVSISTDGGETWSEYADYYTNFQMTGLDMVSETKGFAGDFSGDYSGGMWVLGEPALVGADFAADETEVCIDGTVTFTNESFGTYDSLLWEFGAGASPATSTDVNPGAITFTTEGTKDIKLTLYADGGEFAETKYGYINVYAAPTADFTFEPFGTSLWFNMVFTSTSTNTYAGITEYNWTWGDGNTSSITSESTNHMYPQETATYDVTLNVSTATCSDEITKQVTVTDPNSIGNVNDFTFNVYPNPTNGNITITDVENGNIYIYSMNGQLIENRVATSNTINVNLDNYQSGIYTIKVVNNEGTAVKQITVQ